MISRPDATTQSESSNLALQLLQQHHIHLPMSVFNLIWMTALLGVVLVAAVADGLHAHARPLSRSSSTSTMSTAAPSRRSEVRLSLHSNPLLIRGGCAPASAVRHIEDVAQFDEILAEAGNNLVVVDFSAEWCSPCKMIAPVFEELAVEVASKGAVFCKIDVDKTPDLADRFEVQGMPTFVFMRGGVVVDKFSGASIAKLRETVETLLAVV